MTRSRWRIQRLDVTASTNDDVRRAAEAGETEGLVVVASQQSAGRGRRGRVWESPVGNLYCSTLLRPKNMPRNAGLYSFAASLAVRDVVVPYIPNAAVTLKWPNDVLVSGKKISGILLEVAGDALIVGIGVNVLHSPKNALYPATSLLEILYQDGQQENGMPAFAGMTFSEITFSKNTDTPAKAVAPFGFSQDQFLNALLDRLGHWHDLMQTDGFAPVCTDWLKHAQQGSLTVRLSHETVQGEFVGLDETGHLRLRLADGAERSISTGDVVLPLKD